MKRYSLTKSIIKTRFISSGTLQHNDGSILKAFEMEPLSSGLFEDGFAGPNADALFQKLSDLLTRLPNLFDGQIILFRTNTSKAICGLKTTILLIEKVKSEDSYSHLLALMNELRLSPVPLTKQTWTKYLSTVLGPKTEADILPDVVWEKDGVRIDDRIVRALSLTELPQLTWKACLQPIYESEAPFSLSLRFRIPDRRKIRKQLETKRRVSHALSVTNSLEVRNIESNSVLHSSEETLERILVHKESLFEISMAIVISGSENETRAMASALERTVSGVGNAGLYLEGIGTLPLIESLLPGGRMLGIRTLPILSENLSHIFPIFHDYSRTNDRSSLALVSRTGEVSHLNLFSSENLNFNSFICGASGAGKSFLMNAILSSTLKDDSQSRICIFDIGGSYRKIVQQNGGTSQTLTVEEAQLLISGYLRSKPVDSDGFYRVLIETLCGAGTHITHSHRVAIDDLLKQSEGDYLKLTALTKLASKRTERFYQDIAHWLKPYLLLDSLPASEPQACLIGAQITAFDFKSLESNPVLQRTTILLLSELLWKDLITGKYTRTLIVFDEVWKFFAQSKSFLEEMYRTLRKYRAGIVSITQNLADYGDEAFSKMIFSTSGTKIFLQNGASADFLRETLDLSESDISRILSISSKKPYYSEFFALSPSLSQVFRLYPTPEFYELANTENVAQRKDLN